MVVTRALRTTGCASCRLSLLRTFSSVAGIPIRPPQAPARFPACHVSSPKARFSSRVIPGSEQQELSEDHPVKVSEQDIEKFLEDEGADEEPMAQYNALAMEEEALDAEVSNVPWYLQVDTPQRAPRTLSERQKIPDLPESPPEILQPLLHQISVDLGLDDLTLLDLRKLDPPPALGSNLLMVIGTARSEKHLHVSADRLCRWLRSTYKLRPDADGLLGRNELKLKLKRKSRRAKLMGNTQADEADDGVRTGWVCVNVGVVEGPKIEAKAPVENAGFVGFGRRTDGISIVVQMLTEEKRAEIDLEKLWTGILRRGTQQVEGSDNSVTENAELTTFNVKEPTRRPINDSSPILSQTRGFHTSAHPRSREILTTSEEPPFPASAISANPTESFDLNSFQESVLLAIQESNYEMARGILIKHSSTVPGLQNGGWRALFLDILKMHLENMPKDLAYIQLGHGSNDYNTTPFLKSFYQSISSFPSTSEWEARIWLHCFGREAGHKGYTVRRLLQLLSEIQLSGGQVGRENHLLALRSLLLPAKNGGPHPHGIEGAIRLLQTMYDQGIHVLSEDVFMAILEGTEHVLQEPLDSIANENPKETFGLPDVPQPAIQQRAHILMNMVKLRNFSEESRIRLLDLYARQQTWAAFWDTFRVVAREGKPRSSAMYACMFENVALAKNQTACQNVLRTWLPEMETEEPAVGLEGDVKLAVMACLKIAEPFVEEDATDPGSNGEWAVLWRRCVGT